jgi:hypothetical protein
MKLVFYLGAECSAAKLRIASRSLKSGVDRVRSQESLGLCKANERCPAPEFLIRRPGETFNGVVRRFALSRRKA